MSVADRIGLMSELGWLTGHSFLTTWALCLLVTPVLFYVIGIVFEGRIAPILPTRQFLSFMPGDLLLSTGAALLLWLANQLPEETHWYTAQWWHLLVLASTAIVAFYLTYIVELKGGVYPWGAVLSPTKLYHNVVLYCLYGYLIITTAVAVLWSARSWWLLAAVICFVVWGVMLWLDGSFTQKHHPDAAERRLRYAHVPDWRIFGLYQVWKTS